MIWPRRSTTELPDPVVDHRRNSLQYLRRTTRMATWPERAPTASTILAVLYPDTFTVYDIRVCKLLGDFHRLHRHQAASETWREHQRFDRRRVIVDLARASTAIVIPINRRQRAALIARQTRSGVAGISMWRTRFGERVDDGVDHRGKAGVVPPSPPERTPSAVGRRRHLAERRRKQREGVRRAASRNP